MLARQCDGLGPGSRLPNDSHVSLPVDDAEEAEANYGMIIGDEHPNDAGFESFPAGVRTNRVGMGRLHDRQIVAPGTAALGVVKDCTLKGPVSPLADSMGTFANIFGWDSHARNAHRVGGDRRCNCR